MKPDYKQYPTWGVNEDEIGYLRYRDLFVKDPKGGAAIDFHAGKEYVDMDPIHEAFNVNPYECPRTKIPVYQGDSWGTEGIDYVKFGEITLPWDFKVTKPEMSNSPKPQAPQQWNKVVVKKFKTRRLADGSYEISYIK